MQNHTKRIQHDPYIMDFCVYRRVPTIGSCCLPITIYCKLTRWNFRKRGYRLTLANKGCVQSVPYLMDKCNDSFRTVIIIFHFFSFKSNGVVSFLPPLCLFFRQLFPEQFQFTISAINSLSILNIDNQFKVFLDYF